MTSVRKDDIENHSEKRGRKTKKGKASRIVSVL